ncbi:MAG: electron transfer flavoprotein subunit alpha/FixB family protein [Gemmatimonadales bacterium]
MGPILAVLEQRSGSLKKVSREVIAAAKRVAAANGGSVEAIVLGPASMQDSAVADLGVESIRLIASEALSLYQPDLYAATIATYAEHVSAVVLAATSQGKDLGPRVAAKLGVPLLTDVTEVSGDDGLVVTRPVYSGKALAKIRVSADRSVISVRPNAFGMADRGVGAVSAAQCADVAKLADTIEVRESDSRSLDVAEANVVVSGGRGLKEPEHFALVEELAAAFQGEAAVGASRAVVDAGWRPHSEQVGQTGKTVSPTLYIAVGISGAVQHLAGMKTAKVIVAVNRDKDAPIFKIADYGIVGDLFEIIPRLTEEIGKIKAG